MAAFGAFSFYQGEDFPINIRLRPAEDVLGWTVSFKAWSAEVSFIFPPSTIVPADAWTWPLVPIWTVQAPGISVIPGVQPQLPTIGSTTQLYRDNIGGVAGGGIIIVDSSIGLFQITLSRALTLTLPPGNYWWQFQRIDEGNYRPYAEGTFLVLGTGETGV